MFKHIRKITSLLLVLALVTVSMGVFTVSAEDGTPEGKTAAELFTPSENSLYSVTGLHASADLCTKLESYGIHVQNDTLIEVIPTGISRDATALQITSAEDNSVTKTLCMFVDEEGKVQPPLVGNTGSVSTREGSNTTIDPNDDSFVIRIAVSYNRYNLFYYRPISALFTYSHDGSYKVTKASIEYGCCGYEFTYPGLVAIENDSPLYTYTYTMSVSTNNPQTNTVYSVNDPYRSDRVINTASGINSGQYVDYSFETDKHGKFEDRWVFG